MKEYRKKLIRVRRRQIKVLTREQLEESYMQLLKMSFQKTELIEGLENKLHGK